MMNNAALAARRAYKRKWAKENPDKVRAQQERYWTKKAAELSEDSLQDELSRTEKTE